MDNGFQKNLLSLIDNGEAEGKPSSVNTEEIKKQCLSCNSCGLRRGCSQVVYGHGDTGALIMLVGEAPGAEEDSRGIPFVGSAGQLLDRILLSVNIERSEVYITNIVKCRPPGNRLPVSDEVKQCITHLEKQIDTIDPRIIVCLGSLSTRTLIDKDARITRIRGQWVQKNSRLYMPTFHPAALLRDPGKKRPVWEDFKQIEAKYREILNEERRFHE